MLYDEEGRPHIEPPLLPEDVHVFWIVTDYQRMFYENGKLHKKIARLRETISRMNGYQFAQVRINQEQQQVIRKLKELLKRHGIKLPIDIRYPDYETKQQ
jgi:hypothetical protein